jgi:hypothetical protein
MEHRKRIESLFDSYWEETKESLAASLLVLSQIITEAVDRSDHKIAVGIRVGLFGTGNDDSPSVDTAASRVGDGLEALAESIDGSGLKNPGR